MNILLLALNQVGADIQARISKQAVDRGMSVILDVVVLEMYLLLVLLILITAKWEGGGGERLDIVTTPRLKE